MNHLWKDTVTIVRESVMSGPKNDLGQDTPGDQEIKAKGFFTYTKGQHTEGLSYDGTAVLFLPKGTPIDDMDVVVFEGLRWRVAGPPIRYRSPFQGNVFMQADLERVDGK